MAQKRWWKSDGSDDDDGDIFVIEALLIERFGSEIQMVTHYTINQILLGRLRNREILIISSVQSAEPKVSSNIVEN
jgi:hypothetical protein